MYSKKYTEETYTKKKCTNKMHTNKTYTLKEKWIKYTERVRDRDATITIITEKTPYKKR